MLYDPELYFRASRFAAEVHHGQRMPGTELPYLLHLSQVVGEVACALAAEPDRFDPDLAIACAWLHDALEDTEATFEQLKAAFGEPVARGVLALTKDKTLEKAAQMPDSLDRILRAGDSVALVKLADRTVNLQPPPHNWTAEKIRAYANEAREILGALGHASAHQAERLKARFVVYEKNL